MLFALLELVPKKANGRVSPEYRVARVSGAAKRAGRWVRASAAVCRVTAGTKGMQSAKMRMSTVRGCMVVVCVVYVQKSRRFVSQPRTVKCTVTRRDRTLRSEVIEGGARRSRRRAARAWGTPYRRTPIGLPSGLDPSTRWRSVIVTVSRRRGVTGGRRIAVLGSTPLLRLPIRLQSMIAQQGEDSKARMTGYLGLLR